MTWSIETADPVAAVALLRHLDHAGRCGIDRRAARCQQIDALVVARVPEAAALGEVEDRPAHLAGSGRGEGDVDGDGRAASRPMQPRSLRDLAGAFRSRLFSLLLLDLFGGRGRVASARELGGIGIGCRDERLRLVDSHLLDGAGLFDAASGGRGERRDRDGGDESAHHGQHDQAAQRLDHATLGRRTRRRGRGARAHGRRLRLRGRHGSRSVARGSAGCALDGSGRSPRARARSRANLSLQPNFSSGASAPGRWLVSIRCRGTICGLHHMWTTSR